MATEFEFTLAQRELIEGTTSVIVEACPGAGKTQAIVQRFISRPGAGQRRGLALLSFTNAATYEAGSRCAGNPGLIRAPNFVGTIDSFVNHFIVAPPYMAIERRVPSFKDSWSRVPRAMFNSSEAKGQVRLDWFSYDLETGAHLDCSRVPKKKRHTLEKLKGWQVENVESKATKLWRRFTSRGIFDATTARLLMRKYLHDETVRERLAALMECRFSEVIVDEVQDCCEEDEELLAFLLESGIRVVAVGDFEQAIFGFRTGSSNSLPILKRKLPRGRRLDGNYRSSRQICSFVDSLRSGQEKDYASGTHADVGHAIQLVRYRKLNGIREDIFSILTGFGYSKDDVVVLAHAESDARACAGAGIAPIQTDNKLVRLAISAHSFQERGVTSKTRTAAFQQFQICLRELAREPFADLSEDRFYDEIGMNSRGFDESTLRLALSVERPFDLRPSEFKKKIIIALKQSSAFDWLADANIRIPNGDCWPYIPTKSPDAFKYSTIHKFKGLQSPVVALVIPNRGDDLVGENGVDLWASSMPGEARRVLYVGASRAEQLLIVIAHHAVFHKVTTILQRDDVAYHENVTLEKH